ncbi:DUF874 domain-containing protein [Lutimaribacter marinistellae]|uniref:DUF874 domain-containing protein n=1 Tax=Lutimaribacter marinistellae TaxID=1820329 RepID=A0ABV7TFC4_9RHOB
MGSLASLDDFLHMLRRRALLIVLVSLIGCMLSLFWALSQQHEYEASEVIQIAQPRIADNLARTTVEGSSARRLQAIQHRLMTRDSVLETMEKYGLYANLPALTTQEKVARFRQSVRIDGVAAARDGMADDGTISVLTITARMPTALLAQQIAHEFGQRTVELSKQNRIENARETLAFFDAQEQSLLTEIASVEDEITDFRRNNNLVLPSSLEVRREEISSINSELLTIARERIELERAIDKAGRDERPATAERLRGEYREQLSVLDAQEALLEDYKREIEALISTSPQLERQLGAYERELEQLRAELDRIHANRLEAELGFRLEAERQSERLMVIEEAVIPDYPVTESRKKKAVLGGAASFFFAVALAFLLDLRSGVIRSATQMESELGIAPVVTVPILDTRPRRRWIFSRRRRRDALDKPAAG